MQARQSGAEVWMRSLIATSIEEAFLYDKLTTVRPTSFYSGECWTAKT